MEIVYIIVYLVALLAVGDAEMGVANKGLILEDTLLDAQHNIKLLQDRRLQIQSCYDP